MTLWPSARETFHPSHDGHKSEQLQYLFKHFWMVWFHSFQKYSVCWWQEMGFQYKGMCGERKKTIYLGPLHSLFEEIAIYVAAVLVDMFCGSWANYCPHKRIWRGATTAHCGKWNVEPQLGYTSSIGRLSRGYGCPLNCQLMRRMDELQFSSSATCTNLSLGPSRFKFFNERDALKWHSLISKLKLSINYRAFQSVYSHVCVHEQSGCDEVVAGSRGPDEGSR